MDIGFIKELWDNHRGKILGISLGLVFGWFTIVYGIIKAVFVSFCIAVGFYVGKKIDENTDWRLFWNKIFNNHQRKKS